ncbi:histidine kinase dimerization/phosphoacceptor domain -containing protein [Arenibaculum pallidiluteum]|uniref:histidine kinase dimerization/phosphoacceptor domain -containing protein n=1 Tax=Arenibaculum pallidiluteum TaxID=2812559 RepID=UPI001A979604|nr:histidine kinase dimerization/phosphoacceptor domain -containing protein [Arenibaculum pallidiluteum]
MKKRLTGAGRAPVQGSETLAPGFAALDELPVPAALLSWPGPRIAHVSRGFPAAVGTALADAIPNLDPALVEGVRNAGMWHRLPALTIADVPREVILMALAGPDGPAVLVLLGGGAQLADVDRASGWLDALMRYLPEGLIIAEGPDVTVRLVSDYGLAQAGGGPEAVLGLTADKHVTAWRIFRPDGTPAADEDMPLTRATWYGEVITDTELLLEHADGRRIPILCSAGPVRDASGAIVGGVAAWRDISALKRAEGDLRASELRHRLALAAALMGDWEIDLETDLVERSPQTDRLFGIAGPGPLPAPLLLEQVHPDDRPTLVEALTEARLRRQPIDVEIRVGAEDGPVTWLAVRGEALDAENGRPQRLIGVAMDITRRKLEQDALAQALAEKEAALARSRELFGEVHHRVKNSLQLVASLLNLQGRMLGEAAEVQFGEAYRRVLTVANVHERLYRTGRVSAVEFGDFLCGLCKDAERGAVLSGRDCTIEVRTTRVELPTERVVPLALVANELLSNVLHHAYPGEAPAYAEVVFEALPEGGHRLSVSDRGVGLPDNFDPTRARTLGMKLVSALMRQVEGRLSVERLPTGTRFAISF